MKKTICSLFTLSFILFTTQYAVADSKAELDWLITDSAYVLDEWAERGQNPLPDHIMQKATAIAVVPAMVKGGLFVAISHGTGVVTVKDRISKKWSPPAFTEITGTSVGFQAGFEKVDLILVFVGRTAPRMFLKRSFKLGVDMAIVVANEGFRKEVGMDYKIDSGTYSMARSKGIFVGISFEGATMGISEEKNQEYYGKNVTIDDILFMQSVKDTKQIQLFHKVLKDFLD
ncbi:MAG: lipid-binding SYLF domain-containing protein [Nitrospinae bacterium]|nr:lipid-binding SYLF domain-containing protein [Nitrospinota bacterium]